MAHAEIVDSDVWLACAVPLSRLPVVGSQVYYFPHGHAEQCPAPLPAALPTPHLFPCTVTAVRLDADAKTNEVYADISLQPGPHRGDSSSSSSPSPAEADADAAGSNRISYYAKQLTQSDANNGGGFSVPRYCADFIFPKLDFEADPPGQSLLMRDTRGKQWRFRHIYRGTPRRHLLTHRVEQVRQRQAARRGRHSRVHAQTGRGAAHRLRRAPRYPMMMMMTATQQQGQGLQSGQAPLHNARAWVPPEDVMEAACLAAEGSPFTVASAQGSSSFRARRWRKRWPADGSRGCSCACRSWRPRTPDARIGQAALSSSCTHTYGDPLEVDWDDSSSSSTKSSWQVQLAGYPPLLKRLRLADTTLCSGEGNDSMAAPHHHRLQQARRTWRCY